MTQRTLSLILFFISIISTAFAQEHLSSSEIRLKIEKLNTLGSVLYFAAHPDDENTRLIAYLANERNFNTSYLSLTRGDGGQNLIGTEQGIELGLIRTQELLAARNIDKGQQYFSSAYDFGFSKTHEETFSFWKKDETLKEAVYIIRKLQPDVIITRFPPDSRGGHGHHQASAILAHEAYLAAADPNKFPEQLKTLKPWKAKRLVWNTANFGGQNNTSEDQLKLNIGQFNPYLGYSYGEIAALSRSQHKSQGFGSASNRGNSTEYFEHVVGDKAKTDLFEGIDFTWNRLGNSADIKAIQQLIPQIAKSYNISNPALSIPSLIALQKKIKALPASSWKEIKIKEVEEIIIACLGIVAESITSNQSFVVGQSFEVRNEIIVRSTGSKVKLIAINGKAINADIPHNETQQFKEQQKQDKYSQPYWLESPNSLGKFDVKEEYFGMPENPYSPSSTFEIDVDGLPIKFSRKISYKYVDPVNGEILEPISILPIFSASIYNNNILIQKGEKKSIAIVIKNNSQTDQKGTLSFKQTDGLVIDLQDNSVSIPAGKEIVKTIILSNPNNTAESNIELLMDGKILTDMHSISYPHIPNITWFPPLSLSVKNIDLINPIKKVAYIPGAGDLIPSTLENIGIQVDLLSDLQIQESILKNYDAVIVGIRAYNVKSSVNKWLPTLINYAEQGGTVLVQYNVNSRIATDKLGPYPFNLSRSRVTEEDAKVTLNSPQDVALNYPNKITDKDFDGWVQERGLYFAEQIDPKYRTPLSMSDKNEALHNGSLLIANYGKGKFVYTSLSFFRQLPAAVPGAYRLFVNLLTKEEKQ